MKSSNILSFLNLFVAVILLILTYSTYKKVELKDKKVELKKNSDSIRQEVIKDFTEYKLSEYKLIIDTEYDSLFISKYKLLDNMVNDSTEFIDGYLLYMIINHKVFLHNLITEYDSEYSILTPEKVQEKTILLNKENQILYEKLCKKYNYKKDLNFRNPNYIK